MLKSDPNNPTMDNTSVLFRYNGTIPLVDGAIELDLPVNMLYTLSTIDTAQHGQIPSDIPPSAPFPDIWTDNFQCMPFA